MSEHIVGHITTSEQGTFAVSSTDTVIGECLRRYGHWGWHDLQEWMSYLKPTDNVVIVGAHIGTTLVPMARVVRSAVGIEANPETYKYLTCNMILNGSAKDGNVVVWNIAISDKRETLKFMANRLNSGGSKRVPLHDDPMYDEVGQEIIEVQAYTLDERFEKPFDAIFMDIEGSEYFALKGMPRHLEHARLLVMEFIPHHLRNVSGVTPEQLAALIVPYFDAMIVPTLRQTIRKHEIAAALRHLFDHDHSDDGLIFIKEAPQFGMLDPTLI